MKKQEKKKACFQKDISCEAIIKHFNVFQQFIDNKVGIVLVPFLHVLFMKFIKEMQDGCGSFYETTDFSQHDRIIKVLLLSYTENVFTFVHNGKIVDIQTNHRSLLEHLPMSDVFKTVCAIDVESSSKDAVAKIIEYFEDFVGQQDFDEIKKEVAQMIRANPSGAKVYEEIKDFYL
ncbi:MAG: hypothetical protein US25_C0023G0008 [Candidatus Moranbacteria bacterium GW2011_GWE1_36_7]|nr:MAG: hypothetical protein UR99_C0013G0011 [Candidatus Moranbacteria bacterium GW2011_GWD2_36_12]KKQ06488.1 MAG: hypothetical protein US16_C0016G0006 [Candidatus Moranbacteria bacterium GW2011_GWE2_36_40]KKQ14697.1 MAG: hypothetical protein US25_C0023G0008 [Candidatus Moranbacteria bacterium GW2011_GWE1_36_7]